MNRINEVFDWAKPMSVLYIPDPQLKGRAFFTAENKGQLDWGLDGIIRRYGRRVGQWRLRSQGGWPRQDDDDRVEYGLRPSTFDKPELLWRAYKRIQSYKDELVLPLLKGAQRKIAGLMPTGGCLYAERSDGSFNRISYRPGVDYSTYSTGLLSKAEAERLGDLERMSLHSYSDLVEEYLHHDRRSSLWSDRWIKVWEWLLYAIERKLPRPVHVNHYTKPRIAEIAVDEATFYFAVGIPGTRGNGSWVYLHHTELSGHQVLRMTFGQSPAAVRDGRSNT